MCIMWLAICDLGRVCRNTNLVTFASLCVRMQCFNGERNKNRFNLLEQCSSDNPTLAGLKEPSYSGIRTNKWKN